MTWGRLARIGLKTLLLFAACNLAFALLLPLEALGRLSLYNILLPGRERLPYGENPAASYNLTLNNLPAMLAAHAVSRPKTDDAYRVFLLGDSATWGWLLHNPDTLAGQLNAAGLRAPDGRRVVVYNLAYPTISALKDLLILDAALPHTPDLIVWMLTLDTLAREGQADRPLTQANPDRVQRLIQTYDLAFRIPPADETWHTRTLIGQRRALADLLRLQAYGFAWYATGIDQAIPPAFTPVRVDQEASLRYENFASPQDFTEAELTLDVLAAGVRLAGEVPMLFVNQPIFITPGQNRDLRYNSRYPRWAYDTYRALLAAWMLDHQQAYLDVWDIISPTDFTDSPLHLTASGTAQLAGRIAAALSAQMTQDNRDRK